MNTLDRPLTYKCKGELKKTHLNLFEGLACQPDGRDVEKMFCILCTPRSGSTLFADTLNHTGLIGICEEWFNYDYFAAFQEVSGQNHFTLRQYIDFIKKKTVGDTGVFSIKWHIAQVKAVVEDFDLSFTSFKFDHIIYTYRKNKIAQAVSLAKAVATDQFRFDEEKKSEAKVDLYSVADCLMRLTSQDRTFNLQLKGFVDKMYPYEQFTTSTAPYDEVLRALGKTPPKEYKTRLKKQADEHSEWLIDCFTRFVTGDYE